MAALDPGIAGRLLAMHPRTGHCMLCHKDAPCSPRLLALAAEHAGRRTAARPATPPALTGDRVRPGRCPEDGPRVSKRSPAE